MATATIELNDDAGVIAMTVTMQGGFQEDSHAHAAAARALEFLDDLLQPAPEPETPKVMTSAQVDAVKGATLAHLASQPIIVVGQ